MVTLETQNDRQLYFEIYEAVAHRCEGLYDRASFQERDVQITDAAFRKLSSGLATGEFDWDERQVNIARYVANSVAEERRGMLRREGRFVSPSDNFDPLETVADPRQDVFASVSARIELEERMAEELDKSRELSLFVAEAVVVANELPERERQRFVAVMLKARQPEKSHEEIAVQVAQQGFGMPNTVTMRQWCKRYTAAYVAHFESNRRP